MLKGQSRDRGSKENRGKQPIASSKFALSKRELSAQKWAERDARDECTMRQIQFSKR